MGLKPDTSFLKYLTMGAVGARAVLDDLAAKGFKPVELERPGMSNKIWNTKVKRLRLPDILCTKSGIRIEVRAKSDLKIKMSDTPNNALRAWDVGLRDEDLVAFVGCSGDEKLDGRRRNANVLHRRCPPRVRWPVEAGTTEVSW